MPQSFFKACEDRCLVTGVDIDDAIGQKPGLGDGGREEVLAGDTPQHLASRTRGDSRGKQRRRRAVDGAIAPAGDLMQGAEWQSALRQMLVNGLNAERQHSARTQGSPFETLNAFAKRLENRKGSRCTHVLIQLIGEKMCSLFVPFVLSSQLESVTRQDEGRCRGACIVRKTGEMFD